MGASIVAILYMAINDFGMIQRWPSYQHGGRVELLLPILLQRPPSIGSHAEMSIDSNQEVMALTLKSVQTQTGASWTDRQSAALTTVRSPSAGLVSHVGSNIL